MEQNFQFFFLLCPRGGRDRGRSFANYISTQGWGWSFDDTLETLRWRRVLRGCCLVVLIVLRNCLLCCSRVEKILPRTNYWLTKSTLCIHRPRNMLPAWPGDFSKLFRFPSSDEALSVLCWPRLVGHNGPHVHLDMLSTIQASTTEEAQS